MKHLICSVPVGMSRHLQKRKNPLLSLGNRKYTMGRLTVAIRSRQISSSSLFRFADSAETGR